MTKTITHPDDLVEEQSYIVKWRCEHLNRTRQKTGWFCRMGIANGELYVRFASLPNARRHNESYTLLALAWSQIESIEEVR